MSCKSKSIETESKRVFEECWDWEWGPLINGNEDSYWKNKNVLKLDDGDDYTVG